MRPQNCDQPHPSSYKECPSFHTEKAIIKIQVDSKLSYPAARKEFQKRIQSASENQSFANVVQKSLDDSHKPNSAQDPEIIECKTAIAALKSELNNIKTVLSEKDSIILNLQKQLLAKDRIIENYRRSTRIPTPLPEPTPTETTKQWGDMVMEDDTQQLPTLTENNKRSRSRTNSNSSQKNRSRSNSKDRGHLDEVEIVRRNLSTLDKRVLTAYNELREQHKTTGKTHKYYYNTCRAKKTLPSVVFFETKPHLLRFLYGTT